MNCGVAGMNCASHMNWLRHELSLRDMNCGFRRIFFIAIEAGMEYTEIKMEWYGQPPLCNDYHVKERTI